MKSGLRQAKAKFFMAGLCFVWAPQLGNLAVITGGRGLGLCVGTPIGPDPGRTHFKEDLEVVGG